MIRHALFDLDNTLYPDRNNLMDEMNSRIESFFQKFLRLPPREAQEKRIEYRTLYGTALRGLVLHHAVEPADYLAAVHQGLPRGHLSPNPGLRSWLSSLDWPCSIFSNAPGDYIDRVLSALEIRECFTGIFDIAFSGYLGKPDPRAYGMVLEKLGLPGAECLFVEDSLANLGPAKDLGMTTVLVGSGDGDGQADFRVDSLEQLPGVFRRIGAPSGARTGQA